MFTISVKVTLEGKEVVNTYEDPTQVDSIDKVVKEYQRLYGVMSTIEVLVWRANWQA